jgi:hypothetical protein
MKLQVNTTQYIFPPRPQTAMPFADIVFFTEVGWGWQYKINDSRCLIKYLPNGTVELWNRHAERFRSYTTPTWLEDQLLRTRHELGLDSDQLHILDGGLYDQKHAAIKDTICIWDILVQNGLHLLGTKYKERFDTIAKGTTPYMFSHPSYEVPAKFGSSYDAAPNVFHLEWCPGGTPQTAWDFVHTVNAPFDENSPLLEGMVFKDPDGILEMGLSEKNNESWLCRTRVKTGRHPF